MSSFFRWIIVLVAIGTLIRFIVRKLVHKFRLLRHELKRVRNQCDHVVDFLNHFSRQLGTVAELEQTMQLVANYLRDILGAESLAIFARDRNTPGNTGTSGRLRGLTVSGLFPAFEKTAEIVFARSEYRRKHLRHEYVEPGKGILGRVAESKEPLLVSRVAETVEFEEFPSGVESIMVVPMFVENRLVGIVCAVNCEEEGRYFDESDLEMLVNLSFQAALANNIVEIYSERNKQDRILQELEFGRELQQSLLPAGVPEWGEYSFAVHGRPALEVAGDYYDFVEIDEQRMMIVVGDATGKGVPACMLMAMCRSFVRSLTEQYEGLERFLKDLNIRLFADTDAAMFVTMGVVVIDRQTHVCEYGRAGHTELLLRQADGNTVTIHPEGPALGLLPEEMEPNFDTLSFCFNPGTDLLIFTDGITEARNAKNEEFGLSRLEKIWDTDALHPERMAGEIVKKVEKFAGKTPQVDDQTLVLISRPVDQS